MGVIQLPPPNLNFENWVLIATDTSTATVQTFNNIPVSYSKLMIIFETNVGAGGSNTFGIRINNDSTASNYQSWRLPAPGNAWNTVLGIHAATSTGQNGYMIISNANTTSVKISLGYTSLQSNSSSTTTYELSGYYNNFTTGAAITRLDYGDFQAVPINNSGTRRLYGLPL